MIAIKGRHQNFWEIPDLYNSKIEPFTPSPLYLYRRIARCIFHKDHQPPTSDLPYLYIVLHCKDREFPRNFYVVPKVPVVKYPKVDCKFASAVLVMEKGVVTSVVDWSKAVVGARSSAPVVSVCREGIEQFLIQSGPSPKTVYHRKIKHVTQ